MAAAIFSYWLFGLILYLFVNAIRLHVNSVALSGEASQSFMASGLFSTLVCLFNHLALAYRCCWVVGCGSLIDLRRFLAGCRNRLYYILAVLLRCWLLGPFLCIVSFRWYVFCLLVLLRKLSVLAK